MDRKRANKDQYIKELQNEIKRQKLEIKAAKTAKTKLMEKCRKNEQIVDQLVDKVECPVCLEIPRSLPVHVCPNGHVLCEDCRVGAQSCPKCRVNIGNGKSLLANIIIENIEHKCKYDLCNKTCPIDEVLDHEKGCKHRIVTCPYARCDEKFTVNELEEHLEEGNCCFKSEIINNRSMRAIYEVEDDLKEENDVTWKVNTFKYEGNTFVLVTEKFESMYFFSAVMLGSKGECSNFKVELEVYEEDVFTIDQSEVRLNFVSEPSSIDEVKEDIKYLGLVVNNKVMEKIMEKSPENAFTVDFTIMEN